MAQSSERIVVPGDKLATIEEYLPGIGTYTSEGIIYASQVGTVKYDARNKRVAVTPTKPMIRVPALGTTVIGVANFVRDTLAFVDVWQVDDSRLDTSFTGILKIENSSPRYEESMRDVCKAGDILRARVIEIRDGNTYITTAGAGLGVVVAFCSICGTRLAMTGDRGLQCPQCGNRERRRYAADYGKASAENLKSKGEFDPEREYRKTFNKGPQQRYEQPVQGRGDFTAPGRRDDRRRQWRGPRQGD